VRYWPAKFTQIGVALCLMISAAPVGAQSTHTIPITNPAMIRDADARERLKYLASCALNPGDTMVGAHDGVTYEFPGSMGLAPHWAARGLTQDERRWVSACILARTNAFGVSVLISMRADPAPANSLSHTPAEAQSHTTYEGGFFGDIFADPPQSYVCASEDADSLQSRLARERRQRVCTLPSGEGSPLSRCGFTVVAPCDADHPPVIGGEVWPQVIHVWLEGAEPE